MIKMTQELIKVTTTEDGTQVVSARELYEGLGVTTRFNTWVKSNFEMFDEGVDYIGRKLLTPYNKAYPDKLQEVQDYELTISMSKELSMMSRTQKGREYRNYFLALEDMVKNNLSLVQDSYAIQDPVERAKRWIEEQEEKQALEQALEIQAPKVDYYEKVISSDETLSVTQIASDYGMSAIKLNKLLHNLGIQYKVNGQWVLYSGLSNKGYTESTVGTNDYGTYTTTKWTQKGKEFLYNTLKEHDIYTMDDTVELAKEQGLATMF